MGKNPNSSSFIKFVANCGENQMYSFCARGCEPQCNHFRGEKCPPIDVYMCYQKCICNKGYLRIEEGNCVKENSKECGGKYNPLLVYKNNDSKRNTH